MYAIRSYYGIFIWMVLDSQPPVCLFDLCVAGIAVDAKEARATLNRELSKSRGVDNILGDDDPVLLAYGGGDA